jgi:hypothetical protein
MHETQTTRPENILLRIGEEEAMTILEETENCRQIHRNLWV